jgi:hypothetical protein
MMTDFCQGGGYVGRQIYPCHSDRREESESFTVSEMSRFVTPSEWLRQRHDTVEFNCVHVLKHAINRQAYSNWRVAAMLLPLSVNALTMSATVAGIGKPNESRITHRISLS